MGSHADRQILESSATELARAIREGRITAEQCVRVHVDRVRAVNPSINAVVRDRFADAFAEAAEADRRVRAGDTDLPPFHGVPCTTKEAIAFEGMPHTSGLLARRDVLATEDATTVRRLRDAGAIVLGVTNVSELCMWMESDNRVWGRTNNPYDLGRTAGGSSGGEGAIVGAGAVPFGLGSDVGGSIRMPAFFNGVFGHKATGGVVPSTGHYPPAEGAIQRYLATGPLTRRAEDLMPLLRVLAGPDGREAGCTGGELGDPATVDLSRLTVVSIEKHGLFRTEPVLLEAQQKAARALEARGARVVSATLAKFDRSIQIWGAMLHGAGGASFRSLMAAGQPFDPLGELVRYPLGRSRYTLAGLGLSVIEQLPMFGGARGERAVALGRELRAELDALFATSGPTVVLHPSHPKVAPRHGNPLLLPIRWAYTAIFNVMELPVTQVPLGLDRRGLPLGVQVVGPWGADHLTIAVACALEEAFGGWTPPPTFPL